MTQLSDVFSLDLLADMQEQGMVRKQVHPYAPYAILNYTEKAAFDGVWNEVTLACRGLIYHQGTQEVIARPFKKFMNYGQKGAAVISATELVSVTDKMDGSLGIFYRLPNGNPAIATRGSFMSDQALHATELWYHKYGNVHIPAGVTPLFEIVYRKNRIVLDYGDMDDLVLLGAVDIATGHSYPVGGAQAILNWPGPVTKEFPFNTMFEALAAAPRPNAEGFVVHSLITDERVKIKQEDYIALHKIVTNLSERTIWEGSMAGKTMEDIIAPLPDEFHQWAKDVLIRMAADVFESKMDLEETFMAVMQNLTRKYGAGNWMKKEFAQEVARHADKWALFMLFDGHRERLEKELWKRIKPAPFLTPSGVVHNEDTA